MTGGSESFLDERRERLAASAADANGLAGLEVDPADMARLILRFVHPLPGQPGGRPQNAAPLAPQDLRIRGGDRIRGFVVLSLKAEGRELEVKLDRAGDFSIYTLSIRPDLAGFDPILREIAFAFRLRCDAGDCAAPPAAAPAPFRPAPRIDYLARDYEGYRRMALDRMAVGLPDWTERNPADQGVVLVEWLAYLADLLSYKLDHVAAETSPDSARLRQTAARSARLTGYRAQDGAAARVFAQVRLKEGAPDFILPRRGVAFLTRTARGGLVLSPAEAERAAVEGAVVFEPLAPVLLRAAQNEIALHAWGDRAASLQRGARFCDLRDPQRRLKLRAGDLLILAQNRDPLSGRLAEADPEARQAVRLTAEPEMLEDPLESVGASGEALRVWRIRWGPEDALRFDLFCGARPTDEPAMALALGNLVLADHGFTLPNPEPLGAAPDPSDPEAPPAPGRPDEPKGLAALDRPRPWRPRLARRDLAFAVPYDPAPEIPAARLLAADPGAAQAQIRLRSSGETDSWSPVASLIGQPPDALVFVPEVEADGSARLRFGRPHPEDSAPNGRPPTSGEIFEARYRIGGGREGNLGAGALVHIVAGGAFDASLVAEIRNPLPASGGTPRESPAETRRRAPTAFRRQARAVTLADYEALLNAHPEVRRAVARKRWLGGWSAIFLSVDRAEGLPVDEAFRAALAAYLEPYRMMGHDLAIDAPIFVPLELKLKICARPDVFADHLAAALAEAFSAGLTAEGRRGFFHPDNLTFGTEIFLSRIYEAALALPGVADVTALRFGRLEGADARAEGVLRFGPREIPILSNDPNRPGEGRLTIVTGGGR